MLSQEIQIFYFIESETSLWPGLSIGRSVSHNGRRAISIVFEEGAMSVITNLSAKYTIASWNMNKYDNVFEE